MLTHMRMWLATRIHQIQQDQIVLVWSEVIQDDLDFQDTKGLMGPLIFVGHFKSDIVLVT